MFKSRSRLEKRIAQIHWVQSILLITLCLQYVILHYNTRRFKRYRTALELFLNMIQCTCYLRIIWTCLASIIAPTLLQFEYNSPNNDNFTGLINLLVQTMKKTFLKRNELITNQNQIDEDMRKYCVQNESRYDDIVPQRDELRRPIFFRSVHQRSEQDDYGVVDEIELVALKKNQSDDSEIAPPIGITSSPRYIPDIAKDISKLSESQRSRNKKSNVVDEVDEEIDDLHPEAGQNLDQEEVPNRDSSIRTIRRRLNSQLLSQEYKSAEEGKLNSSRLKQN